MSYGHGAFGGPSRCYDHFASFMKCMEKTTHPQLCILEREDYFECLHFKKLKTRGAVFGLHVEEYVKRAKTAQALSK